MFPFIQLESATGDGGTQVYPASGQATETWTLFKTPAAPMPQRLFIGAPAQLLDDCFVIDDVAVRKQ